MLKTLQFGWIFNLFCEINKKQNSKQMFKTKTGTIVDLLSNYQTQQ